MTSGFFYHTASLQKNGSYRTVKNPQVGCCLLYPSYAVLCARGCPAPQGKRGSYRTVKNPQVGCCCVMCCVVRLLP